MCRSFRNKRVRSSVRLGLLVEAEARVDTPNNAMVVNIIVTFFVGKTLCCLILLFDGFVGFVMCLKLFCFCV